MLKDHSDYKKFRVVDNFEDKIMQEFLSWIRFVEFDENITLIMQYQSAAISAANKHRRGDESDSDDDSDVSKGFKAKDLPPLTLRNERKVLEKIHKLAKDSYDKYETSYEDDLKLLEERIDMTFNERNCVLYRSGEKKILKFLMNSTQKILPLLDMDFKVIPLYILTHTIVSKKGCSIKCFIRSLQGLHQQRYILPNKERKGIVSTQPPSLLIKTFTDHAKTTTSLHFCFI